MATLNFPDAPSTGDVYTDGNSGFSYEWNGTVWISTDPSTVSNIREIDDISGDFDGSDTTFTLKVSGVNVEPANAQQLIVSVGGVMQNAGQDFTVSGAVITFTTAPSSGLTFFGVLLGTALSLNTIPEGGVTPASLTTTSNYVMNGLTLDQGAGIITAFGFQGGSITADLDSTFAANVSIAGSLTVQGTQTIINTDELNVQDKTIGIGSTNAPTSTTQDDAGVIIYGQTHVNILYDRDKAALGINTGLSVAGFVTATQVDAGTRLVATAATVGSGVTINNTGIDAGIGAGIVTASSFVGGGANITALSGSNIASGTVAAARVATLNQNTTGTSAGLTGTPNIDCGTGSFTGDVDIADKIVHTGDTNTAIRFPTTDTITAETSGSERVRINSAGGVGINTDTIPSGHGLDIYGEAGAYATLNVKSQSLGHGAAIELGAVDDDDYGSIYQFASSAGGTFDGRMRFIAGGVNDSLNLVGGKVGINEDVPQGVLHVASTSTYSDVYLSNSTSGHTGTDGANIFLNNSLELGVWNKEAGPIRFATTGSERLKITSGGGFQFSNGLFDEKCNITAGKLSGNTNIDLANGMVHYFSTQESTTSTPNIRINDANTLQDAMGTGDICTVTLITTAAAAGYSANLTIDGNAVTEEWVGGEAPSEGGADGLDIYTYTIICIGTGTGDSGFKVIANLTSATN